ncbi:hypothetical protein OIU35_03210 [Boseaceae bacterium BT-24-1]|nr:hypothetical protein [Boseaceae bacterium BT-24-1]
MALGRQWLKGELEASGIEARFVCVLDIDNGITTLPSTEPISIASAATFRPVPAPASTSSSTGASLPRPGGQCRSTPAWYCVRPQTTPSKASSHLPGVGSEI